MLSFALCPLHASLRAQMPPAEVARAVPDAARQASQDLDRKESPFDELRWVGESPEVRLGDVWYRPVSIEGVAVTDILVFCAKRWPGRQQLRSTGGLVVDVRGNGGGERGLLLALAGYLLAPDAAPVVVNVAAYRASGAFPDDHLGGSRHLFRADDPRWTDAQRAAIAACAARFAPEWPLPEGFSPWQYLVLDRTGHADEYHYAAPVVVLSDAGCFSATDIFLAALAELPSVSLVGLPSSGGSARAVSFELPRTGISVRCASMASFRADGRLFDGRGVEVDREVHRAPRDVLAGHGDAQLDAALELLRR